MLPQFRTLEIQDHAGEAEREGVGDYKAQTTKAVTGLENELEVQAKSSSQWEKLYEQQKECARNFKTQRDRLKDDSDLTKEFLRSLLDDLCAIDEADMGKFNGEIVGEMRASVRDAISKI